eukprot:scaffold31356_cov18-Tisochrysis_lutea.AAC.2
MVETRVHAAANKACAPSACFSNLSATEVEIGYRRNLNVKKASWKMHIRGASKKHLGTSLHARRVPAHCGGQHQAPSICPSSINGV